MTANERREACTAPPGQLRAAQYDPRDHWWSKLRDGPLDEVREFLSTLTSAELEAVKVFNDEGSRATL